MITAGEIVAETKAKYGTAEYWKEQYMNILKSYTTASAKSAEINAERYNDTIRRSNDITHQWVAPVPIEAKTNADAACFDVYSTKYGRQVHTWVNDAVCVTKYPSPDRSGEMVYQIALPRNNQAVHLKPQTALKVMSAIKMLMADTSIEDSIAKGAVIINLCAGSAMNR